MFLVPGEILCKVCRGHCCALVKDLINVLEEYGEIEPNEEVCVLVVYWLLILFVYRAIGRLFTNSASNLRT